MEAAPELRFSIRVFAGTLPCGTCEIQGAGTRSDVRVNRKAIKHTLDVRGPSVIAGFEEMLALKENDELVFEVGA